MKTHPLILVAEDDPDMAFLICRELHRHVPWEVCHVPEGKLALERLLQTPRPDVLVTDLDMPGLSGFGLIEAARAEKTLQDLPILVFSSSEDPADEKRCERLHANGFIKKSVALFELCERVRRLTGPLPSPHSPTTGDPTPPSGCGPTKSLLA